MRTERPSDSILLVVCADAVSREFAISFDAAVEWLRATQWPQVVHFTQPEHIQCEH
jgi:hypothetical protein